MQRKGTETRMRKNASSVILSHEVPRETPPLDRHANYLNQTMIVTAPKHNLKPFNLTRNDRNLTKSVINLNYNKTGSILGGHLDDMKKRAGIPDVQRCTSARTINYNPYPERIVRTQRRDAMESRPLVEVPMSHSPLARNGDKNVS